MITAEEEVRALVDREAAAWNARDADTLVSLFHPDTVWPWPPNSAAHDRMQWVMPLGDLIGSAGEVHGKRFLRQTELLEY